jgi:hypothetical protein
VRSTGPSGRASGSFNCRHESLALVNNRLGATFFYSVILTIDAEAHSNDSLFVWRQRGQELPGFGFRMIHNRQSRFLRL